MKPGLIGAFLTLLALWAPSAHAADLAQPPAASVPLHHIVQTVNNCGPASVAEVLDYWGIHKTQFELKPVLRRGEALMNTDDVADYVDSLGMREFIANEGSQAVIKALIANGFPVIVAQLVSSTSRYDHFRPIEAYSDEGQYFVSSDPLLGDGYRISYQQFDALWGRYDRNFMVIYPPSRQQQLDATLMSMHFNGPSWMTPFA